MFECKVSIPVVQWVVGSAITMVVLALTVLMTLTF